MLKKIVLPLAIAVALALLIAACGGGDDDDNGGNVDTGNGGNGATGNGEEQTVSFAEGCQKTDQKSWDAAPERIIDTSKTYIATISTNKGDVVVELNSDVPSTTNNFVFLACSGFYDGLTFHRVEPGFVVQGGDPDGTGGGGPGYGIPPEFEGSDFSTGALGMARSTAPDSAGSQFFVTLGDAPHLDGSYASFGRVTSGMDVAQQLAIGDVMNSVTIVEQ